MPTTFASIEAARRRLGDAIAKTPCTYSHWLSEAMGAEVFLKLENLQRTGSFKERGALNRLLLLDEEERRRGVIAASAGNHAQGVAFHAHRLGIAATIVMPQGTPLIKVARTQSYGAEVILEGENYDEAYTHAREICSQRELIYIHAYDDDDIIAGQGTIGLELIEQNPFLDTVVIPVGGGGLIAGIAMAMKKVNPSLRVVGVEAEVLPSMAKAVEQGGPVTLEKAQTLADGIAVARVGDRSYALCKDLVDEFVTVSDDDVARAILYLVEREKTVAEGAGAAGVAALLTKKLGDIRGHKVAAIVCGGNIDVNVLSRIIERGLAETGRLARLDVTVRDVPGALANVLQTVAQAKANVVEVHHERAFIGGALNTVELELVVETRGLDHAAAVVAALNAAGYVATATDDVARRLSPRATLS